MNTSSTSTWSTWTDTYYTSYDSGTADSTSVWPTWTNWTTSATSTTTATVSIDDSCVWTVWTEDAERRYPIYINSDDCRNDHIHDDYRIEEDIADLVDYKDPKADSEVVAKELLLDLIGPEELAVYEETGRLMVKGQNHDYIIQKDGFLQKIDKGKLIDLCVHLQRPAHYPQTDNVIALMMMLKFQEDKVIEMANNQGSCIIKELPKFAKAG